MDEQATASRMSVFSDVLRVLQDIKVLKKVPRAKLQTFAMDVSLIALGVRCVFVLICATYLLPRGTHSLWSVPRTAFLFDTFAVPGHDRIGVFELIIQSLREVSLEATRLSAQWARYSTNLRS